MRNLDITTLRSFVAVADSGGVTRAAGFLHLTQSAVSMQLKRLEENLNLELLDRSGRGVALTAAGEQLLGYARRILALNDEAWGRLTATEYEGEITLGVPHDIIYPYVPQVLRRFATDFPRMQVKLISAPTRALREMFGRGQCDVIVTTEDQAGPGGEVLVRLPLVWIGATDGAAWKRDPLPVAFCSNCIFRPDVLRRLDADNTPWEMVVESDIDNAVEAVVSADLAVTAVIQGAFPRQTGAVEHNGTLPDPGDTRIIMYGERSDNPVFVALCDMIRSTYRNVAKNPDGALLSA